MKDKTISQSISKALSRLLKSRSRKHFNQKYFRFNPKSRKEYFMLFEGSQQIIRELDRQ